MKMEEIKVRKRKDSFIEIDRLAPDPKNFWSIDLLKVLMMVLVILDHSIPYPILRNLFSPVWERIAIPVFMVILGFNWGRSLSRKKDQSLKGLYSWEGYFKPKIKRFVVPFAMIYGLSILIFLTSYLVRGPDFLLTVYSEANLPDLHNPYLKLFLMLPVWGPGNWFVPMLFLSILIFPLLYKLFTWKRWFSWIMLLVCYGIEFVYQMYINNLRFVHELEPWLMNVTTFVPIQLLTAIALGIWLSIDYKWDSPRNIVIWILGLASLVWVFNYAIRGNPQWVWDNHLIYWDYNYFVYPYSALIVMLVANFLPKSPHGKSFRNLTFLSKSTYHILMTQILYFSVVYGFLMNINYPFGFYYQLNSLGDLITVYTNLPRFLWFYPLNLIVTFGIGVTWYALEKLIRERKTTHRSKISKKRLDMMKAKGWIKSDKP